MQNCSNQAVPSRLGAILVSQFLVHNHLTVEKGVLLYPGQASNTMQKVRNLDCWNEQKPLKSSMLLLQSY